MSEVTKELFKKLLREREELDEKISSSAKGLLQKSFKDFFKNHGKVIDTMRWSQYTPSFNDGDPCIFRYNGLNCKFTDEKLNKLVEASYGDDGYVDKYTLNHMMDTAEKAGLAVVRSDDDEDGSEDEDEDEDEDWEDDEEESEVEEEDDEDGKKKDQKILQHLKKPEVLAAVQEVVELDELLESAESSLESAFGDHCQVVVTADGFEIEEIDHD